MDLHRYATVTSGVLLSCLLVIDFLEVRFGIEESKYLTLHRCIECIKTALVPQYKNVCCFNGVYFCSSDFKNAYANLVFSYCIQCCTYHNPNEESIF